MSQDQAQPSGPDLTQGVSIDQLPDGGKLVGHLGEEEVLLVRRGNEVFAIGPYCTHYHGPLAEGLVLGDTVRCPWHHACFDLRSGEALRAPALSATPSWEVVERDGKFFLGSKKPSPPAAHGSLARSAAEMPRRIVYDADLVILSDDQAAPVDRPNLSKEYLAGSAPEDWVPLRPNSWYGENGIDLRLRTKVEGFDVRAREVVFADSSRVAFDRLLLATGAEPVRLSLPGADQPHVFTLRSFNDSRSI